jgi:hypothetical protein
MAILWNVSSFQIETRYDGKPYIFTPNERKNFYDPNEINHLIYKLEDYGLIQMPDGTTAAAEKPFLIEGLRKRRKMLDFRVRNFRTMNKEREAAKLSPEPPSDLIIETVDEIEVVDKRLKEMLADKFAKVDAFMKTQEFDDTTTKMNEQTPAVEIKGSKASIKKGAPNLAVPLAGHS